MYTLSIRAHLAVMDIKDAESLHHAMFSLDFYRQYGEERLKWFLEHDIKCKVHQMSQFREHNASTYPDWLYSPPSLEGRVLEQARNLVGSNLTCESEFEA